MTWNPKGNGVGLGAALVAAILSGQAVAGPLDAYRWRSRVLVISAADPTDARLGAQRKALAAARPDLAERDLVMVEAIGNGARARGLRAELGLPADRFRAVLVGKDGGVKRTASEPIPIDSLNATIDAMPMRRREMGR